MIESKHTGAQTPQPRRAFRRRRLCAVLAMALAGEVLAAGDAQVMETVEVVGQAASTDSALDEQQLADNILSVVHADAIGQLPDKNVAEALQRVPGVTVERDQGEGRYVRVRGLGPDLNAVTINGSVVPAPESGRRAVALDVLPSGLIQALEVQKTLTPDQDANSIGGTINVRTMSAFDHPGRYISLEAGANHETNVDGDGHTLAGAWSDRFADGKLGVLIGLTTSERTFGSDNTETGGAWDGDLLEEFQRRDYTITRERDGGVFNLEYRPGGRETYYLRSLVSRFSDDEERQRHDIEFDNPQAPGQLGDASAARELKSRKETQNIYSLVLGTTQQLGAWDLDVQAGFGQAEERTPRHVASAAFESGLTYQAGYDSRREPEWIGDAAINDAAAYELDSIEVEKQLTEDKEHNLRLDLGRRFSAWGGEHELKFGGKASWREKTNEITVWDVDGGDFGNPSLSGFVDGEVDYGLGDFGPAISSRAVDAFLAGVDLDAYLDEEESTIGDYRMKEDILAAYVQDTVSVGLWRVLAGVRYEGTRFRAQGTGDENGSFVAVDERHDYHHWLPTVQLRTDLDNDTTVRAAWSHSVVRPTFEQLAPGFLIDGAEAEFGNPSLDPLRSANFDLGIEHRMGYAGALSAYLFHKQIKDFVYQTDVAGSGRWAGFDEAITYENGSKAQVTGLELAYTQAFRQLPAPWNGLLLSANATFSHSKAWIEGSDGTSQVERAIPLPSQSDRSFNLVLGYEARPWSLRLAMSRKSPYLLEVTDIGDKDADHYVDAQTHLDFAAHYTLRDNLQLVFEALNVNDEPYYVYAGSSDRNAQYETYGRTFKLGLKLALR